MINNSKIDVYTYYNKIWNEKLDRVYLWMINLDYEL